LSAAEPWRDWDEKPKAMKKPALRVTKWLGDIPIEARCSLCPDSRFHAASTHHRPQKVEYSELLQHAFDQHVADCHAPE
jgi:hypothetical protein